MYGDSDDSYERLWNKAREEVQRRRTPERLRAFEAQRAARLRLGRDVPPRFRGEQLAESEIIRRLAASQTWRIKGVEDAKWESYFGPKRGFTVRMMRHPDGPVAYLHFVHVIDELYRLVRWEAGLG
ncbi:MAG: hypothetical protein ACR2GA_02975 [Chloroflexota bacterium]